MANRALPNFGRSYANVTMPVKLTCQFTVDATNGAGITGLKSNGYVKNVWMHTSTTPTTGNPNPAVGYILVQLQDNYVGLLSSSKSIQSPLTGSEIVVTALGAALTAGVAYQITTLGTTTAANWITLGLPAGLTPAVGMSFIAIATGAGTGSGKVKAIGVSGVSSIETIGVTNTEMGPQGVSNQGGWILMQCLGATSSSVTTQIPTAPAAGSLISFEFTMENSSATVDGL